MTPEDNPMDEEQPTKEEWEAYEQRNCQHNNFEASVDVGRLLDKDGDSSPSSYCCTITVQCADCKLPFRFVCPDSGMMNDRPCINPNGQELRVYVEPSDGSLVGSARPPGFSIQTSKPIPQHGTN